MPKTAMSLQCRYWFHTCQHTTPSARKGTMLTVPVAMRSSVSCSTGWMSSGPGSDMRGLPFGRSCPTPPSLVIGSEPRRHDLAVERAQRALDGLEAVSRQCTHDSPSGARVVRTPTRRAGGVDHRLVARIEVEQRGALVERSVERVG